ncbi:hypothetical protein SSP531S_56930 [Streptomyces spongiicola]|uniref:Uncharacterized protein n=1 Tax=Streptomyces spongiicola TaxID=1690221 RepID=A0A388T7E5_9ACTN|nr:hypothetical protein SSP531S_56930 [Streptomyces spongiicola]
MPGHEVVPRVLRAGGAGAVPSRTPAARAGVRDVRPGDPGQEEGSRRVTADWSSSGWVQAERCPA